MSLNDATKKGGRDGRSNPYTRQVAKNRQIVLEIMNEAELRLITQKLLSQALQGHVASIKLVFAYAIGKPDAAIDPDEVEALEWETRQRLSVPLAEVEALTGRVPVGQANAVAEAVKQPVAIQVGQEIVERLEGRGLLVRTQPTQSDRPGRAGGMSPLLEREETGGSRPPLASSDRHPDPDAADTGSRR